MDVMAELTQNHPLDNLISIASLAVVGLPERGFVRVPVERKPMAVDFRSLPLVNLLAKSVRRTAEAGPGAVTVSEMLPDLDRLWLRDAGGRRYTAELRLVAVGPSQT